MMKIDCCPNCFSTLKNQPVCPACGYDYSVDATQPADALLPFTILYDRYVVGKVLDKDEFGMIYVALDLESNRQCAVKEYLPSEYARRSFVSNEIIPFGNEKNKRIFIRGCEMFVQEAQSPDFLDSFNENQTAYVVAENAASLKEYVINMERICTAPEAAQNCEAEPEEEQEVFPDNKRSADDSAKNEEQQEAFEAKEALPRDATDKPCVSPYLAIYDNGIIVKKAAFEPDKDIKIGRSVKLCDISVDDDVQISRIHCTVRYDSESRLFWLTDCSTNGTFLSADERLQQNIPCKLISGSVFFLVNVTHKFAVFETEATNFENGEQTP